MDLAVIMSMGNDAPNVSSFLCCLAAFLKGAIWVTTVGGDVVMLALMGNDSTFLSCNPCFFGAFDESTIRIPTLMCSAMGLSLFSTKN
jgi:hypothetical protein